MRRRRHQTEEPNLFALRCEECGRVLVQTTSGYLCCPRGHGKLRLDELRTAEEEPALSLFKPEASGQ